MNKKMKKLLTTLGVGLVVTTITTTSVLANENNNRPTFSRWVGKELNDALSYGLVNSEIMQEDMRKPITREQYIELCNSVSAKIGEIPGVTKKDELSVDMPTSGEITKKDMLEMLQAILTNYEYSIELGFDTASISSFMTELGIIKGDGQGQGLEEVCTVEQAVAMSARFVESTYDLFDADSKGLFWKVESNGNTVYLLGSIHIGKSGMYPIRDEIIEAYEVSDEIYTETNMLEEVPKEVMDMHYYTDGSTVKDYLSEEYYEKLTKLLKEYNTTPEEFGNTKDWVIMTQLDYLEVGTAKPNEDFSENNTMGIEEFFMLNTIMDEKKSNGLETYQEHIGAFDTEMSQQVKTYKLEEAIDRKLYDKEQSTANQSFGVKEINQMQEDWKNGDIDKLNTTFWEEGEKVIKELPKEKQELEAQYAKALIHDRDQIMANSIDKALKNEEGKTYFVIAGAAHFVSDIGVLTKLEEKGYKIERIK